MPNRMDVLLGAQWGDEGKGKYTDAIAPNYDAIARFQGGPNAGHTIYVLTSDGQWVKVILHQICSGILADKLSISGDGMVIDPSKYLSEIKIVLGYKPLAHRFIKIAQNAGVILPVHILLDHVNEYLAGEAKIGSTLRGIGPAYEEQTGRRGPKFRELLQEDAFAALSGLQQRHLPFIQAAIGKCQDSQIRRGLEKLLRSLDADLRDCISAALELSQRVEVIDCGNFIRDILDMGGRVLAEGAQGALLDKNCGMYPYVTSSITTTPGVATGLGVSFREIGKVLGVFKAYCTKVGRGPFPTEYEPGRNGYYTDQLGLGYRIQRDGDEFGSTTKRPRRCGALDLVLLKHTAYICGFDSLLMTMLDVFNGYDEIEVCVGYENMTGGLDLSRIAEARPIIQKLPWGCHVTPGMKNWSDLPEPAKDYVRMIEAYVGVPISMISTGPQREQVIRRSKASGDFARVPGGLLATGLEGKKP